MTEPGFTAHTRQLIDDLVARTQADGRAPSLIAAVVRSGVVAHVSGAGETPVPDRGLQYRIGSITKTMTAILVLGLRDQGHLDLDDPVAAHLPALDLPGVRIRHLLGHAAGLQREPDGLWWERHPGGTFDELVAGVGRAKLAFGRYEHYHYSNLAYGLLGGIVERLTGRPWFDALQARLLGPLEMTRTTYQATEPFARGYVAHPLDGTLREEPREDAGAMAPAGQLWSTVDDMANFVAALAGHRPEVLPPSIVDEMARPVIVADPDSWTNGYGLGLSLERSGDRVYIGHTGSMPGYLAMVGLHRPSDTGVVAFANTYTLPRTGIARGGLAILDAIVSEQPVRVAPRPPRTEPAPADVAPLLGTWWWMGREHTARWESDALVISSPADEWRFTPEGPDRWRGQTGVQAGEVLSVLRDPAGTVTGLDIATFVFRREPMAD